MRRRLVVWQAVMGIALFLSFMPSLSAETIQSRLDLQVQNNLISVQANDVGFKEILATLAEKTGIRVIIMGEVPDHKVSVSIQSMPTYGIDALLKAMQLKNYGVVYDPDKASLAVYVLQEGTEMSQVAPNAVRVEQASFKTGEGVLRIKDRDIVSVSKGKHNVPIRYIQDELLVKFHLGVRDDEIKEILHNNKLIRIQADRLGKVGYVKTRITDGRDVIDVAKELRKDYRVKAPEPNYISNILTVTDPLYPQQWYVQNTHFDQAWELLESKQAVKVAVIDSGVDSTHEDLQGKILSGYDFVNDDADSKDDNGHGTFISGIIAANANDLGIRGLYQYAQIIPVKAIDSNGLGTYEDVAAGIIFAADNEAQVINLSIGGYAFSNMLQDAIDYAFEKGCIVVAAGGNDGIEQPVYPAAYPDVIGVSATDQNDEIWPYSNRGGHIDVCAPGVNIVSTKKENKYGYFSGTSISAAIVTANTSLVIAELADFSVQSLIHSIFNSSKDLGAPNRDKVFGHGLIDSISVLNTKVDDFHDIAVRKLNIDASKYRSIDDIFLVADIENLGSYNSEIFDVTLYILEDNGKIICKEQKGLKVIDRTKIDFRVKNNISKNIRFTLKATLKESETNIDNNQKVIKFNSEKSGELFILHKVEQPVHQFIAYQASRVWKKPQFDNHIDNYNTFNIFDNGEDRFLDHLGYDSNGVGLAPEGILIGSGEEDEDQSGNNQDDGSPNYGYGLGDHYNILFGVIAGPFIFHFWDPDNPIDQFNDGIDRDGREYLSNYHRADFIWKNNVIRNYLEGIKYSDQDRINKSYYYLGRVAHLLTDMAVPAHVHGDQHGLDDDSFEDFVAGVEKKDAWETGEDKYDYNYNHFEDVAEGLINKEYRTNNTFFDNRVKQDADDFFKLFWYTAQKTQFFASDGIPGNSSYGTENDGIIPFEGGVLWDFGTQIFEDPSEIEDGYEGNIENLKTMSEALIPHAIKAVAGLYRLFWEETHGHIEGIVRNQITGYPIAGATIRLIGPSIYIEAGSTTANAISGGFKFYDLEPFGNYYVTISHPGYETIDSRAFSVKAGDTEYIGDFYLKPTSVPSAPVLNPPDFSDLNNVKFSWGASTCTDCGAISYNLEVHDEQKNTIFKADQVNGRPIYNEFYPSDGDAKVKLDPDKTYYWAIFPVGENGIWNVDVDWQSFSTGSTACTIGINPNNNAFAASGGNGSITISTASSCGWTAISQAGWATITSTPSGTGGGSVSYSVAPNSSTSSRYGKIQIGENNFNITQAGAKSCGYSLSHTSSTYGAQSNDGSIGINAPSGCDWTAQSHAPWIHITSIPYGTGSGTLTFNIDAYPQAGSRDGTMTIAGNVFSLTQIGVDCTYKLSKSVDTFSINGGIQSVNVLTPAGCPWGAVSSDSWLEISPGSGTGPGSISYVVRDYDGVDARSATLSVQGRTLLVTQGGTGCGGAGSSISPQSASFSASGGQGSVIVTAASDCTWSSTALEWVAISPGDDIGTGNDVVNYTVQANTTNQTRIGGFFIAQQLFTIIQEGVTFEAPDNLHVSDHYTNSFRVAWGAVDNAEGYTLQKATNNTFTQNLEEYTTNATYKLISTGFNTYYFRVKALNGEGDSGWSSVMQFSWYTDIPPNITDNMLLPADESEVSTNSVTLSWHATGGNGQLRYTLYHANWAPAEQPPIIADTLSTEYTISGLSFNETYYWRVKVVDEDGDEDWTNTVQYTILPESAPPNGNISIENGSTTTNSVSVTLNLSASDAQGNVVQMQFSNDGSSWSNWGPYSTIYPSWNLGDFGGSTYHGSKTVFARFKDNSGNISDVVSDTISLEEGMPGNIMLNGKHYASLRRAVDDALPGETIHITAGWYDLTQEVKTSVYFDQHPTINIGCALKDGVNLKGEGAGKTTLYWNDGTYGLVINDSNTVEGLTLIRPTFIGASRYVVMFAGSNSTLRNCIITNSDQPLAVYGGSSNSYSNITINNCVIYNNQGWSLLEYITNLRLLNNVIANNSDAPILRAAYCSGEISNNIISGNGAGVSFESDQSIQFRYNNVWNNTSYNYDDGDTVLHDQTGINGNISQNPMFQSPGTGDFQLLPGSTCINAGTNVGLPSVGVPDIGAFEYNATGDLAISSSVTANVSITMPDGSKQTVTLPWSTTGLETGIYGLYPQDYPGYNTPEIQFVTLYAEANLNLTLNYTPDVDGPGGKLMVNGGDYFTQSRYVTLVNDVNDSSYGIGPLSQMQFSNDGTTWSTPEPISNKKIKWDLTAFGGDVGEGMRTVFVRYSDNGGNWSDTISDEIKFVPDGRILVVPDMYAMPHDAAAEAQEGDIIFIRSGEYQRWEDLQIPSGIRIQGSDKNTTVIRPRFTYLPSNVTVDNITWITAPEVRLQGTENLIISNAVFDSSAYVIVYANDVQADIRNSIFNNGNATAYLYNSYSQNYALKITNSVFDGRTNTYPGGIFTDGGLHLKLSGYSGNAFPTIQNNIFYGFDNTNSTAIIVYNNDIAPGDITIGYNNFFGSTNALDDMGVPISMPQSSTWVDPRFLDTVSYKLSAASSLINGGKPDLVFNNHDGTTNTVGIEGGPFYNTPPIANALAIPAHGGLNTVITFDASASSDEQTDRQNLLVRWDFNGDGVFDTGYLPDLAIQYQFTEYSDAPIICWIFDEHFAISTVAIPNPTIDADSDNDGIPDRTEDANLNGEVDPGETDAYNPDSDGDGVWDGIELGLTLADLGPGTDTAIFVPDSDPSSTTRPLDPDSNGDGISDGEEDANQNGSVDSGETDPAGYGVSLNSLVPNSGCRGTQITINGINFGDGNQTTQKVEFNPNVFANNIVSWADNEIVVTVPSGAISGCVRVITDGGKSDCIDFQYEDTHADFSASAFSGNLPLSVTFTDLSTCRINSWSWDFGDGNSSSEPNPIHTYDSAGTYTVRLTVAGTDGVDSEVKNACIQVFEPVLSVTPTTQAVASGGGSAALAVSNTGTGSMAWTASTQTDWVTIDSGVSGMDAGVIALTIAENAGDSRTGFITVTSPGANGNPVVVIIDQAAAPGAGVSKIFSNDCAEGDNFGFSVDVDGDRLIVGAPFEEFNGYNSGSVYVFSKSGDEWVQQGKLNGADTIEGDSFGHSVSISGDYAVAGAICDDDGGSCSGSAYIFHYDGATWRQMAKLTANDAYASDRFGGSVAIDGDWVIVGAHYNDDLGSNSGSAYIFQRIGDNWIQQPKILPSDGAAGDNFGISVSIDGNMALVGSPSDDDNGPNSGSVYVFQWTGSSWNQAQKLTTEEGFSDYDRFGRSVSISGSYLLIGAVGDDDGGANLGAAYVYSFDGASWSRQAKLENENGNYSDAFGLPVSISDRYAVIGAQGDTQNGSNSGAAYVFKRDNESWVRQPKIVPADGTPMHLFGYSTAISDTTAFVGAYCDNDMGGCAGTVYAHDLSIFEPQPVTVSFTANPTVGNFPLAVAFIGYSTGNTTTWLWDFGDGTTSTEPNPVHTYAQPGLYTVSLTVDGPGDPVTLEKAGHISVSYPAPMSKFNAANTYGFAPLQVNFSDESMGEIDSWLWDFGDGNSSAEQNPIHTYTTGGDYTVSLTVTGPGGENKLEKAAFVTAMHSAPVAAFTSSTTSGTEPLDVTFTDESTGAITSWNWDFGDGVTSTEPSPAHTYTSPGTYAVSLMVTGPGGSDSEIKTDYIVVTPINIDSDSDGIPDPTENSSCTNPNDADTDDDGILDGVEDSNHDAVLDPGETDPCEVDTDADGIQDGTELGLTADNVGLDTDGDIFRPDMDPTTTTDPSNQDSDSDSISDGEEDINHNGVMDSGETDAANQDTDNDGSNDGQEITNCSNPCNPYSIPKTSIMRLKAGFNMVAIPADLHNRPTLNDWLPLLGTAADIEKVLIYDGASRRFIPFIPDSNLNPSYPLQGGEALIVYAKRETAIGFTSALCNPLNLAQGYNFIGAACAPEDYSAFDLLSALGSENAVSIQRYNTPNGQFESAAFTGAGQPAGVDFAIVAGEGYVVNLRNAVIGFMP